MNKCELNEEKCSLFRRREWTTESGDIQKRTNREETRREENKRRKRTNEK